MEQGGQQKGARKLSRSKRGFGGFFDSVSL